MSASASPKLLVIGAIPAELRNTLQAEFSLVELADLPPGPAPSFRVAVTTSMDGIDATLMNRLAGLRLIACNGAGLDRIDLAHARKAGVVVCNTPDAVITDAADFALALVFAAARRIVEGDRYVRSGHWAAAKMSPSRRVRGKRLGILGFGKIGSTIADRAGAMGLEVAYCARSPKAVAHRFVPDPVSLAAWSDFLVLALPGGRETKGLVDAKVLRALGPEGYLVNIARGSVVDEGALLHALRQGTIAGAALDVFENEPRINEAFFTLDNVVLTPHVAAVTHEARADMAETLRDAIRSHFARG